jgi:hypothetical protein
MSINENSCPTSNAFPTLNIGGKQHIIKSQSFTFKYHHGTTNDQGLGKTSIQHDESAGIRELEILVDENFGAHTYERGCSFNKPLIFTFGGFAYVTSQWEVLDSTFNAENSTVTLTIISKFVRIDENRRQVGFTYQKIT